MISVAITAQIAVALGLMHIIFTMRVGGYRLKNEISLGDGGDAELLRRMRGHGNFVETVPMALMLILINELNGLGDTFLCALGVVLVLARLGHYFSIVSKMPFLLRPVCMVSTLGVILVASIALLF